MSKQLMVEWRDPITNEVHVAPERFTKALAIIQKGAENAKKADVVLAEIGEEITEANKRHLRQITMFARSQGTLVLSVRSSKGGYYIANTEAEVIDFVTTQKKLAESMIRQADSLAAAWNANRY